MRWRWLLYPLVALIALSVAGFAVLLSGMGRGPKVDGDLVLPGLTAPVEVVRDTRGIPYVFAANLPDLIRAQGFVAAQARLFQMEAYRALASGQLAEAIGARGLANDREMRTLGLRRNAERHALRLAPAARDFLLWYAQGINAYIEHHKGDHPAELSIAGFTARPWSLADMVLVLHFVNHSQAANYKSELLAQLLIDKLGPQRDGQLAAPITGSTQTFRPVALDLDGDGIEVTDRAHGIALDVDDTGYLKQTAWVPARLGG